MRTYITEALGTGILVLVVGLAVASEFIIPTPLLAALTLGLLVYSFGHVSGVHINPAVTIAVWVSGQISLKDASMYVVAQMAGTIVSMLALHNLGVVTPPLDMAMDGWIGVAELVGTAVFVVGIAAVVAKKVPSGVAGAVIGGSLLLGISLAILMGSNGILNPAVALAVNSFNLMYLLGPIMGAVLGMQLYNWLAVSKSV
jgi:glycerol uptake facilitator-like aquaporin